VHALGRFRIRRLDIRVGQLDIAILAERIALDDVLLGYLFAGCLVDLLVADTGMVPLIQQVEIETLGRYFGREQLHSDTHQPETERSFPDSACHGLPSLPLFHPRLASALPAASLPPSQPRNRTPAVFDGMLGHPASIGARFRGDDDRAALGRYGSFLASRHVDLLY